jgi:hypothetical protein
MAEPADVGTIWGFDIRIPGMATLVPAERACVYGILCDTTGADLSRVCARPGWRDAYTLKRVFVETRGERWLEAAICCVAEGEVPARPSHRYFDAIVSAADEHGFPQWYREHLESFRHGAGPTPLDPDGLARAVPVRQPARIWIWGSFC